jgi:hypothetical protein
VTKKGCLARLGSSHCRRRRHQNLRWAQKEVFALRRPRWQQQQQFPQRQRQQRQRQELPQWQQLLTPR